MAATASSAATTDSTSSISSNDSRLQAIRKLLDRYRYEQIHNPQLGYYVHPALHYETDEWGGIAAQVTESIKSNEILLVIPEQERLSFRTIGPQLQPQSLYTHYLPAVLKECETSLKDSLHCDNIVAALLIMYLWKNGTTSSSSSSPGGIQSDDRENKHDVTNLDLFLKTWPSQEDLQHLYLKKEDRSPWLQGTYAEYYMQQRSKADDLILDAIFKVMNADDLRRRFCDDPSRSGFHHVFSSAWKIVDSRCHDGLPGEEISTAILPIVDLTNGLPTGCNDINVRVETEIWEYIRPKLPVMTQHSATSTMGTKSSNDRHSLQFPVTQLIAVGELHPNQELLLDYGALPPSSFLVKYGCIPSQFLREPQLLVDSILLQYPPTLAPQPEDTARIEALQRNDYPTTLTGLEDFLTWLTPNDLKPLVQQLPAPAIGAQLNYIEPESLRMLRQYLIIAKVGDNTLVQTFLETSRIRGQINPKQLGLYLIQIIDYNLSLLYQRDTDTESTNAVESQPHTNTTELEDLNDECVNMTFILRTCTMQRILYRDALAQWRHVICRFFGIPSLVDQKTSTPPPPGLELGVGCGVCGKTMPFKRCSKCKQVGYCCRDHQRADWKFHKKACVVVGSK